MTTQAYDIQVSECRKEAKSIGNQIWTDEEIKTKIKLRTSKFHADVGKTTPYDATTETDQYSIAKQAIISLVAADLMKAVEAYKDSVTMARNEYSAAVKELVKAIPPNNIDPVSDGANFTDELDADNYIDLPSDY